MDRQAIAEDVVGLWDMIDDAWLKVHSSTCKTEAHIALFERAHAFIIHRNISAEKGQKIQQAQQSGDADNCTKCGRKFTEKEMKFLNDQPDKPRICYHCTKGL